MARLSLRRVSHAYAERRVLHDLSVDVEDGELFVLLGPSGSGKSTVLRLIAGLEPSQDGSILIGERDVSALPPNERNVGMVFQSYALFPHLTVAENIAFGLRARRVASVDGPVREAARVLGIEDLLDRAPRQLSGGERQRVALARALVRHPDVLLMDEPLSNLDAQLRVRTRGEILRLQHELATTMIYVTHDQTEALGIGHRIAVLRDGRVEQVGTPQEIYDRPANLFVATFVGTPPMNILEASADEGVLRAGGHVLGEAAGVDGEVLVGVRPEHVHVAGSRWSGHAEAASPVPARIELIEPAGDQMLLTLATDAGRMTARVEPSFRAAVDDRAEVWLGRVHVFDPSTERRMGASA